MATQAQLIDRLDNLSKSMQQYWDPETFFSELLQIFGASKTLVEKSIYDCNKNEKDHSLNHSSVKLYHADLFCDKRAYFRFPAKDEDTGIALKEVKENLTKIRGGG